MSGRVEVVGVPGLRGTWYVVGQVQHRVLLARRPGVTWTLAVDERHVRAVAP